MRVSALLTLIIYLSVGSFQAKAQKADLDRIFSEPRSKDNSVVIESETNRVIAKETDENSEYAERKWQQILDMVEEAREAEEARRAEEAQESTKDVVAPPKGGSVRKSLPDKVKKELPVPPRIEHQLSLDGGRYLGHLTYELICKNNKKYRIYKSKNNYWYDADGSSFPTAIGGKTEDSMVLARCG